MKQGSGSPTDDVVSHRMGSRRAGTIPQGVTAKIQPEGETHFPRHLTIMLYCQAGPAVEDPQKTAQYCSEDPDSTLGRKSLEKRPIHWRVPYSDLRIVVVDST